MTKDDLIEAVCTALNDFKETTKRRIRILVPIAIGHIMSKHQWECRTKYSGETVTSADYEYVNPPEDFDRGIALWREDWDEPIEYITPNEYAKAKAESSTPYSAECVKYTVMGGDILDEKRIYFLDPPTSAMTIKMLYSRKIDTANVASLPDQFIPVIIAYLIYRVTPPYFDRGGDKYTNPSFVVAERDYRNSLANLVSYEQGQKGRLYRAKLDDSLSEALEHYHP
jgi:hypothetical protein